MFQLTLRNPNLIIYHYDVDIIDPHPPRNGKIDKDLCWTLWKRLGEKHPELADALKAVHRVFSGGFMLARSRPQLEADQKNWVRSVFVLVFVFVSRRATMD